MRGDRQKVVEYYRNLESKLGYEHITWKTKHFGYYPDGVKTISEPEAQQVMMDMVAKKLKLKPGQVVLDAGCGYGTTSCYLAKKYQVKVVGIDINKYEIKQAIERSKTLGVEKQTLFKVMDYAKLTFPKQYFDAIFTLETLSHAPDVDKTLRGFRAKLKPMGKIALFEYTLAPENDFTVGEKKMLDIGIEGTAALGLRDFHHDQFVYNLKKAGFKQIKEENITRYMLPSLARLRRIAFTPYFFVRLLNLQKNFVNTSIAVEWYELVKKDLIRYCVFTA
jgi:sterol 24-C-methyltransferase